LKSQFALGLWLVSAAALSGAEIVTVGAIQMATGNPSPDLISFIVSNVSGPGCDATFNSCTPLVFNQGVLQITYLDALLSPNVYVANLPDGFGPGDTDPSLFIDFTIDPTGWTLQTVSFSGTLTPADIVTFGGNARTLSPLSFAASFNSATQAFALLTTTADEPPLIAIPEPGSAALTIGALTMLGLRHRTRRQRTN